MSPVIGCRSLSWESGRSYSSRPLRMRVAEVDGRRPRRRTVANVTVPRSRSSQSVQPSASTTSNATRRRRITMVPRPRDASHGRSRRTEQPRSQQATSTRPRKEPRRCRDSTARASLLRAKLRTMYKSGRNSTSLRISPDRLDARVSVEVGLGPIERPEPSVLEHLAERLREMSCKDDNAQRT